MIYVFDFDGVLFDTVDEIATLGYCSLKNINIDVKNVPEKFYEFFRLNRPRPVDGAGMSIVAKFCLDEFEKGKEPYLIDRDEFYKIYDSKKDIHQELEEAFFSKRALFISQDPDSWCKLNKPYAKIWELLKDKDFYIVSNKDISSITLLLNFYGKKLDENKIFSGDQKGSKAQKIYKIYKDNQDSISFVDDAIDNLIKIKEELHSPSWLTNYLAGWGYINPEDKELLNENKDIIFLENEKALINNIVRTNNSKH